jgi:DNA-binding MurR/RpiR family transcriptional regulator
LEGGASMNTNLNAKQEKAIMALLTEPTIRQAAERAGVGETTLYRWLQEEVFSHAFREARKMALSQTISRLQQTTTKAVDTLEAIMNDDTASASSRVTASKTVLEMAFKAFEVEDLATKVEELQKYIEEAEAG